MRLNSWVLTFLVAGCASSTPEPMPEFQLGEAVLRLEEGAEPPTEVDGKTCEAATWASARTVLLKCGPVGDDPNETLAMIEKLGQAQGVKSAEPNMIRRKIK